MCLITSNIILRFTVNYMTDIYWISYTQIQNLQKKRNLCIKYLENQNFELNSKC